MAGDERELGLALGRRDAWTEPGHDMDESRLTIPHPSLGVLPEGREDVRVAIEAETRRRDAGNRVRLSLEYEPLTDRRGASAEAALPQTVADDRDRRRPGTIVFRAKRPSQREGYFKHVKHVRRDLPAVDVLWFAWCAD